MKIDLRKLVLAGHKGLQDEHENKEDRSGGNPRVGTSGVVTEDGVLYGTCQRIAIARKLGLQGKAELDTEIMWKWGEANEWHWDRLFNHCGYEDKIETDYSISHKIDGVKLPLVGHADAVFLKDGKPIHGVELKGIFGYTTMASVRLADQPKSDNLIQSAAYSHIMKIPYTLAYTSGAWTAYKYPDKKKYGLKEGSSRPFYKFFELYWKEGKVFYKSEASDEEVETVITAKGIEDYYRLVEELVEIKELGPRPVGDHVDGTPAKWGPCGLCEHRDACDKHEDSYEDWVKYLTDKKGAAE